MSVLQLNDIDVCYRTREGRLPALRGINFTLARGEIIGVVGESGCGKSTLAYTVNDLLPSNAEVTGGEILFRGEEVRSSRTRGMAAHWGRDVSMIFQDPMASLNPVFTIEEQILSAMRAQGSGGIGETAEMRERMFAMLERVGISDPRQGVKAYPHEFSGGMRQRIMIAIALLSKPALLIADEPTSALDVTLEAQINDLIAKLIHETDTAVLYITHDLGVVAQICDKVMVMYAGEIVEFNDVHTLFSDPRHPYTQALLRAHPAQSGVARRLYTIPGRVPNLRELPPGCKFAPRCSRRQPLCTEKEPVERDLSGHRVLCHFADQGDRRGESRLESPAADGGPQGRESPVIRAEGLKVHFRDRLPWIKRLFGAVPGTVKAVDGIDILVPRGGVLALVGESGSGKTTTGRTLLRLQEPTAGEIILDDTDLSRLPLSRIRPMREKMQMIFQNPKTSLSPRMKVSSLLLEPFIIHKKKPADPRGKVRELLYMVGLSGEQADKYPHQLSGGQARRVSIARALALNPEIIIADEPTAGLDVSVAAGILNLMKDLRDELQLTYIVITHDLNVVNYIADRIAVMYLGKLVEVAESTELFRAPRHPYTEALLSAVSVPDPALRGSSERIILKGETPSPRTPPGGCPFHTRCPYAEARCEVDVPALAPVSESSAHFSACHWPDGLLRGRRQ